MFKISANFHYVCGFTLWDRWPYLINIHAPCVVMCSPWHAWPVRKYSARVLARGFSWILVFQLIFFSVLADDYQMLPACLLFAALAIQVLHETYPLCWHKNYLEVAFEWKKARLMSNFVWTPEDNWSFQMCNARWISLDISGSAFHHFSMITLWSLRLRRKGFRESGHRMHREVSWKKNMAMSWRKWRYIEMMIG